MPIYNYRCPDGCQFERFLSVKHYAMPQLCQRHQALGERVLTAPLLVIAQPECSYDSPITGEPITSWAQRRNDLAKHGCEPYDPEMKTDRLTRERESEANLDQAVEATVEEAVTRMPTRQRGMLWSELTEQGMEIEVARRTV